MSLKRDSNQFRAEMFVFVSFLAGIGYRLSSMLHE